MNSNSDQENSSIADAQVSATYRSIASESAPAHLDRAVMRQAARGARPAGRLAAYLLSVRRPIAFAATLVLSLGIVLQVNDLLTDAAPVPGDVSAQGVLNKPMPGALGGSEAMHPETLRYCKGAQIESAERWWACIMELDRNGEQAAARTEREMLMNTYPDFRPPE